MKLRPALVYSTTETREAMDETLVALGLYRFDDVTEDPEALCLPTTERPVLMKNLFWAWRFAQDADQTEDRSTVPAIVAVDHISSLGVDRISQIATLVAFQHHGLMVYADALPVESQWLAKQWNKIEWPARKQKLRALVDDLGAYLDQHPEVSGDHERLMGWIMSTSQRYTWEETVSRAGELVDGHGMTFTQTARQLGVEGYRNRGGRHNWYTDAARVAYRASK